MSGSGAARYVAALLLCPLLAVGLASTPDAVPGPAASVLEEPKLSGGTVKSDPEFDLDEDGLLNRDDTDDDGDLMDDAQDPDPYSPSLGCEKTSASPSKSCAV